jgi:homoserine kinase
VSATSAIAFAPATVANIAVGFDLLGHSLRGPGDRVTAQKSELPGVRITSITGTVTALPREPERNTAGRAVQALLAHTEPGFGIDLAIEKGIALSSGLGGSAASAVAALVATNALLPAPLQAAELYPFALLGEAAASGAPHGDNVGTALLGGLVLATAERPIALPVPVTLITVVVHPHFELETRRTREVLRDPFPLADVVQQTGNLALVLSGLFTGDLQLVRQGLRDVLVEPRRRALIPGFAEVKRAALDHGALGASISGGGPSVFGWFENEQQVAGAGKAMQAAFAAAGCESTVHVSPVAGPGPRLEQLR